jgi:hypothetical protein
MHRNTLRFVHAALSAVLICSIVGAAGAATQYTKPIERRPMSTPIHPWWTNAVVELVTNGSFETGDFTGWTVADDGSGSGTWFVSDQATTPLSAFPVPPAADGTFQAFVDQTGPGRHILYQDIVIPASISVTLNMMLWAENYAGGYANPASLDPNVLPNQQARVDIMSTGAPIDDVGAGVLLNVFKTVPGDPTSIPFGPLTANLTAFAGQTVRLRIAEVDNQFFFNVGVDAVSITADVATADKRAAWGDVKARYR